MKKLLRKRSMLLVALLVSLCMPVMAQADQLALDGVSGVTLDEAVGKVVYIRNVATGLYLKSGGEWGTYVVEGRAAQPFYLEKRADNTYAISGVAGYFVVLNTVELWSDWKQKSASRWVIEKVEGLASNQYHLTNAPNKSGRFLTSQGHVAGQLAMQRYDAAKPTQKWVFVTEDYLRNTMMREQASADTPVDVTPFIKASSFDLTDGFAMNNLDKLAEKDRLYDDNGEVIAKLPLYDLLSKSTYNSFWTNYTRYGRWNWHSMIRDGGVGGASVYNSAGIISFGNGTGYDGADESNDDCGFDYGYFGGIDQIIDLPAGKYHFSFEGFFKHRRTNGSWASDGDTEDNKFYVQIFNNDSGDEIHCFVLDPWTGYDKIVSVDKTDHTETKATVGEKVAIEFRDGDVYKQSCEFELPLNAKVQIRVSKLWTASQHSMLAVDNFTLVYYGNGENEQPGSEDLSSYYNELLQAYIDKLRAELSTYPGVTGDLRTQALNTFNNGISSVLVDMNNNAITTEELYRVALAVIDKAYREALALFYKPAGESGLISNPSFENAVPDQSTLAASWVRFDNTRVQNADLATDGSYVGSSAGLPLVQKINALPYGLYRMTADVTAEKGNTVFLMGNYYHKGVTIEETNQMQPVELFFLVDEGYDGSEGTISTVVGAVGGSGEDNNLYNFYGVETVSQTIEETKTETVTETVPEEISGSVTLSSSNVGGTSAITINLSSNKGSVQYTTTGASWVTGGVISGPTGLKLPAGARMNLEAIKANTTDELLITKIVLECDSYWGSRQRGGNYTISNGGTSVETNIGVDFSFSDGYESVSFTNGSGDMYIRNMTVYCIRKYPHTYEKTWTETTVIPLYDKLSDGQKITGCPFKADNFKLYYISDVPNGRLFMELQKARSAKFKDGITPDITLYESMFESRDVDNTGPDGGTDYGYNPALAVMQILRNTAKLQRSAGADMTFAIYNQNFDYWIGHGWGNQTDNEGDGFGDYNTHVNHGTWSTSITDAGGKFLFNTWSWAADHEGFGAHVGQTIDGIPNGKYRLDAVVASGDRGNPGTIYLTARTAAQDQIYKSSVVDNSAGKIMNDISLEFDVVDGTATIGVVGGNVTDGSYVDESDVTSHRLWYKADNFRLTYLGQELQLNELHKDEERTKVNDYYTKVTVSRNIKQNTWSSLILPFDVPASKLTGWEVKQLASVDRSGDHISLVFDDAPDGINAGIPYMVRIKDHATSSIEVTNVDVDSKSEIQGYAVGCVIFRGVYGNGNIPQTVLDANGNPTGSQYYFMSGNKFYRSVTTDNTIKGYRAYFEVVPEEGEEGAQVRTMSFRIAGEDDETVIEDIIDDEDSQLEVVAIYDVNGIRLSEMKPGINILRMNNGTTKKVIIK